MLFDELERIIRSERNRNTEKAKRFLGSAKFWMPLLGDQKEDRPSYFDGMLKHFGDLDLIFSDPDNGMEVASVPPGRKKSSKYLFWDELAKAWKRGHSILIYQHFRRMKRDIFISSLAERFEKTLGSQVISFCTARVVFFLCSQQRHSDLLRKKARDVERQWTGQIRVNFGSECI